MENIIEYINKRIEETNKIYLNQNKLNLIK